MSERVGLPDDTASRRAGAGGRPARLEPIAPASASRVLVVDDEPETAEGLAALLEAPGRTTVTCADPQAAHLLVERETFTHVISDVRLTGPFAFEGLDFVTHVRRHAPDACFILISGHLSDEIREEAMRRGAAGCLNKPFGYAQIERFFPDENHGDAPYRVIRTPTFDEIVEGAALDPHFQPIVALRGAKWSPVAFESLARLRTDGLFRNPELLFEYAGRRRQLVELERTCIRRSLEEGTGLGSDWVLFLNVHPDVLAAPDGIVDTLLSTARRTAVDPSRIVLEITEQATLRDAHSIGATVSALAQHGVRFAFDDVGVAYSHLRFIDVLKPAFLKVSQHFGTDFESDPTKQKIVSNVLSLADSFSCELILEGVETATTAEAARAMGVRYAQGYHFGRPAPASAQRSGEGAE